MPEPNQNPTPDPQETFENVTMQIFGTKSPGPQDQANMSGFLANYATTGVEPGSVNQIMQTYGPQEASVINSLARSFAVCDAWFASVPSQTWPNRGFVHTGSSDGHTNNNVLQWYQIPTIFNVLEDLGKSWSIFMLVVLFDEHGGCYDHVPPPGGAKPPQPSQVAQDTGFKFDGSDITPDMQLNDVQRGLLASAKMNQTNAHPGYVSIQASQLKTLQDAAAFLKGGPSGETTAAS